MNPETKVSSPRPNVPAPPGAFMVPTDAEMDSLRLGRLGAHDFQFKFSVKADGRVGWGPHGEDWVSPSLSHAIDYARCLREEMPFCIQCPGSNVKQPLTEQNQVEAGRFFCPKCRTIFTWRKKT